MLGEEAIISKARNLSGKHGRKCDGHKREGKCALPGEVCLFVKTKNFWSKATVVVRRQEKHAEVSRGHSTVPLAREGLNVE